MTVSFTAYGLPVPQGSTRAFVVKGKAVTTSASKGLKPWRDTISSTARTTMAETGAEPLTGPVNVRALFFLPRPKSRPKRDLYPDRRPDIDKLLRGVLDGITGPVIADDAQVVTVVAYKHYVAEPAGLGMREPGVMVTVWATA